MVTLTLTPSHARDLVAQITQDDDGAHVDELIELIDGIAEPENEAAVEAKKYLKSLGDKAKCACCGRPTLAVLSLICAALNLAL